MNAFVVKHDEFDDVKMFSIHEIDELFMIINVKNVLHWRCFMIVNYNWWIICLTLMFVKSHPFCLKMLLFVWVTCRWSGLVAVDCCCEWLSLTVSFGALIRNGMGNFCYCFLFLAYYFYEFLWTWCWNIWWDFTLRPCAKVV